MTGLRDLLAQAEADHAPDCTRCDCGKWEAQRAIENAAYDNARLVLDMADALELAEQRINYYGGEFPVRDLLARVKGIAKETT